MIEEILAELRERVTAGAADPPEEHVRAALHTRLRALLKHDPGTRGGVDPEDLHQMRVSVRRMRAVLRAARPLLDREWADGLRAELGWLGRSLGPVRDLDVLLERLHGEAAALGEPDAAAAEPLLATLEEERVAARTAMLETLDSDRYQALLQRVLTAATSPVPVSPTPASAVLAIAPAPSSAAAPAPDSAALTLGSAAAPTAASAAASVPGSTGEAPGSTEEEPGSASAESAVPSTAAGWRPELAELVGREFRRLRAGVRAAGDDPPDAVLHALRIQGKRLRYTAELVEPALGVPVRELLQATVAMQDVLGDHQDACVAQQRVRALLDGLGPDAGTGIAFTAGRLVEREEVRRQQTRDAWPAAWRAVRAAAKPLTHPTAQTRTR